MISRNTLVSVLFILAGLGAGYLASRGVSDFLAISYSEKELSELSPARRSPGTAKDTLPLRIVDFGGIGVVPDTASWGDNYEHNQRFFEDVMLVTPPFIDTVALKREHLKMAHFAGRMSRFGYNAMAMPWFLEFINFDKVGNGGEVYSRESIYRARHDSLSSMVAAQMQVAADNGLGTYLWTDMMALTPPLKFFLEERFGELDPEDPDLWAIYGRAAEEAFEKFPHLEGMIIRIGEAGSIYNKPGWDYTSELRVRTDKAVRLMLEAFLSAAEKYDRTIIFRTWSVGIGEIGDMHTNPVTYRRVLGEIQSEHLVVSTKYCSGDFYSWLNLNPTLFGGAHRRIAELQAKREFEGFGILPNYVGALHQAALQKILEQNSKLEGVWVWTQYGGPLRAGPMVIYPFHGFNAINDVNVFAASRLMLDPYADLDSITGAWIGSYFGTDSLLVKKLTAFLNASYGVVLKGLYISEFARHDVRALGLEPPPMLWIFEWDILGASSAVLGNIYFITRDRFQNVIDEGSAAVRDAVALKELLLQAKDHVSENHGDYETLVETVDYEIELFRLLDYYRQFFMNFYRWIDTGDPASRVKYKLAMGQFKATAEYHEKKYAGNLNTLGMDFEETATGISIAEHTGLSVRWARVTLVLTLFLLILGIPGLMRDRGHRKFAGTLYFDSLFRPWLISGLTVYHGTRRLLAFLGSLYILSLVLFSSFTSLLFPLCFGLLGLVFIAVLTLVIRPGKHLDRLLVTLLGPKLMVMSLVVAIIAIRGPVYFWYQVWVSDLFRFLFLSLFLLLLFRKFHLFVLMARKWGNRSGAGPAAMVATALGIQLLAAGLTMHFFGLEESLTALNNDLLVLPGGLSKIMGITTHLGIPQALPFQIILYASGLTITGLLLYLSSGRKTRRRKVVQA